MDLSNISILDVLNFINGIQEKGAAEDQALPKKRMIGDFVIVRSSKAGVFAGTLVDYDQSSCTATLKESRRLWRWWCNKSISLDGVATSGLRHSDSKICPLIESNRDILDVCEIIPTSDECKTSILSAPIAEQE